LICQTDPNGIALIQNALLKKLDNPEKFAIPCAISNVRFKHTLCDLGSSVSLILKSIYDRLGVGKIISTKIFLQLADQSVKLPHDIVKDLPIQVW
jgi:hypothetical protein